MQFAKIYGHLVFRNGLTKNAIIWDKHIKVLMIMDYEKGSAMCYPCHINIVCNSHGVVGGMDEAYIVIWCLGFMSIIINKWCLCDGQWTKHLLKGSRY